MPDKEKVVLFDFCETLVNFQTADAFVDYIRLESNYKRMKIKENFRIFLVNTRLLYVFARIFPRSSINKRIKLWQLKGMDNSIIEHYAESYYNNIVKSNLIVNMIDILHDYQKKGWTVFIVSGGYEIYLKYFCIENAIPLKNLISVKIKTKGNTCLGCFDGGDRLWDKTTKLDEILNRKMIYSVAYSDSITDLPLLKWANKGVVVRRKDKKRWFNNYNFEEIIWEKQTTY